MGEYPAAFAMSKQVTRGDIGFILVLLLLTLFCLLVWQVYHYGVRIEALESQVDALGDIVAGLERKLAEDVTRIDSNQAKCPWVGMGVK